MMGSPMGTPARAHRWDRPRARWSSAGRIARAAISSCEGRPRPCQFATFNGRRDSARCRSYLTARMGLIADQFSWWMSPVRSRAGGGLNAPPAHRGRERSVSKRGRSGRGSASASAAPLKVRAWRHLRQPGRQSRAPLLRFESRQQSIGSGPPRAVRRRPRRTTTECRLHVGEASTRGDTAPCVLSRGQAVALVLQVLLRYRLR